MTKKTNNEEAYRRHTVDKDSAKDLLRKIVKKFEQQWKTLQSAFKQLNLGKSGRIQPWELKYFCNHWGYTMPEAQFEEIFATFDVDGDGEISYQDL